VDKIEVTDVCYKPSYDSTIFFRFTIGYLITTISLWSGEQKLRPTDIIPSKSYVKAVHERLMLRAK